MKSWRAPVLVLLPLIGCDLPGKPTLADKYISPREELRFEVLYRDNCSGCHGAEGKLGPAPPLNDGLFLSLMSKEALAQVISSGRQGTLMPAFGSSQGGSLTDEQVQVLAEGITKHWASTKAEPMIKLTHPLGEKSANGNKEKGRHLYELACASCHGLNGDGAEAGAINNSDFLALCSNQVLRRYIITGRPDLGMPGCTDRRDRPEEFEPLSERDVDDLVAFVASWREPASSTKKEKD
jgi:mono/diheme cytochrome c family protein